MIRPASIMILIGMFLVIWGCGGCGEPYWLGSDNPEGQMNENYRTGSQGIVVSFLSDSPPSRIYEGTYLNLNLEVRNKGAYDYPLGKIFISGHDPTAIHFRDTQKALPEIVGKSAYITEGGYDIVAFEENPDQPITIPFGDSYTPTLMASYCYYYRTIATPTVCIMPTPELLIKEKLCDPTSITMAGGQGAPVAVTKIQEEIMNHRVNFIITIEDIGNGQVVSQEAYGKCPFNLASQDIGRVYFNAQIPSLGAPDCTPKDGFVRMIDGKGHIICSFVTREDSAYTTPLNIQLDYVYYGTQKRNIQIVRIPGTKDQGSDPFSGDGTGDDGSGQGTGGSSDCPCNKQQYCVCIHADGTNYVCRDQKVPIGKGSYTVHGSSPDIGYCGIMGSDLGSCPNMIEDLNPSTGDTIMVVGYKSEQDKTMLASQPCTFE